MTFRLADHCGQYLSELAIEDHRIHVLDGDLADSDGAVHFALKHPERFTMAGIAEQCMVSVAAGMASCGLRPWVFSFGAFLCYRAYDQIRVCLSQSQQPVTLVGSHTGGLAARNGKTHAALNDISLMSSLPHMQVWAPADANDLKLAMHEVLADRQPAYLRLPRRPLELLPGEASICRWLSAPQPITLLGTGVGTHLALAVQEQMSHCHLPVGVFHCPRVSPLPRQELTEALEHCEMIFVIEDHYKFGGLTSLLQQLELPARIIPFGWPNDWSGASGNDEELLQRHGLAPVQIARAILAVVENSTRATSGALLS